MFWRVGPCEQEGEEGQGVGGGDWVGVGPVLGEDVGTPEDVKRVDTAVLGLPWKDLSGMTWSGEVLGEGKEKNHQDDWSPEDVVELGCISTAVNVVGNMGSSHRGRCLGVRGGGFLTTQRCVVGVHILRHGQYFNEIMDRRYIVCGV